MVTEEVVEERMRRWGSPEVFYELSTKRAQGNA